MGTPSGPQAATTEISACSARRRQLATTEISACSAARVPMLPVIASAAVVSQKILAYSYALVAASLAVAPFAGPLYGGCAALLGSWFLIEAHRLRARIRRGDPERPMRLFHASISYLALLFTAVAVSVVA